MTTPWLIDYNKQLEKRIGIKTRDGNIKINGRSLFVSKDSVMIDDSEKTIFTPKEWEIWKNTGFDKMIYEAKMIFRGEIIDT